MNSKVAVWVGALACAALIGIAAGSASSGMAPKHPPVPRRGEVAVGTFQCGTDQQETQGFSSLTIRGTTGIGSTFVQGQFPLAPGSGTPLTCAQLAQQVAADAAAGDCSVGPIAEIAESFGSPQTTTHFVCSGTHDAVIAVMGEISRNFAEVTNAGASD